MGLPTLKSSNLERATTYCKTGDEKVTVPEVTSAAAPVGAAVVVGSEIAPAAHAAPPTSQPRVLGSCLAEYCCPNFNARMMWLAAAGNLWRLPPSATNLRRAAQRAAS